MLCYFQLTAGAKQRAIKDFIICQKKKYSYVLDLKDAEELLNDGYGLYSEKGEYLEDSRLDEY